MTQETVVLDLWVKKAGFPCLGFSPTGSPVSDREPEMVVVEMSHSALALCNRPGYLPRSIFQCYWVLKNKTTETSIKVP